MTNRADIILYGALTVDPASGYNRGDSVAIRGDQILAVDTQAELAHLAGPQSRWIDCGGCSILPGLIDGHAHLDREGLKYLLPSLAGARSIADIQQIISDEAARRAPGEWIVTMPVGTPPLYIDGAESLAEGRYPDRWELDVAAPDNPVYIRPVWGYWSNKPPLVSVANSRALEAAGIRGDTPSPADCVTIQRTPRGDEPTGVFIEDTRMSIVELTLMGVAPSFTLDDRITAIETSMRTYNRYGTTAVYEGHGAAAEVVSAYQAVRRRRRQSVRATLVISPAWRHTFSAEDVRRMVRDWTGWASRQGFGDEWLRVQGIYAEQDESSDGWLRASAAPQTSWAGFNFDAGLPRNLLRELLLEAARNRMRVSTIFPDVVELFAETHARVSVADLRWVRGHISTLSEDDITQARNLGLGLVTHTNRHIAKMGSMHHERLGTSRAHEIVPLRGLVDAGIPVALGSDNLPPSLFGPVADAVFRRDRTTGEVVAPGQALSRREALGLASQGGAWLLGMEDSLGCVRPGYLADLAVVEGDVLTMPEEDLRAASCRTVLAGGQEWPVD